MLLDRILLPWTMAWMMGLVICNLCNLKSDQQTSKNIDILNKLDWG